ncbi:MAG TPA: MerR family transcriptional regulator [Gaiellaceae bacterium]|nr:MerR family transcriptional regulator [Gaiellaceae bacterium]
MRVGEVAERAGVNVETLRYYERRGLLPAPEREPSGHRRYDEETVRFLRAIKEAQALGFTLSEITDVLKAVRRSGRPSEALRVRMAAKIDEIDGGSPASGACARSWRGSSAAPATRSTTAPAAPPTWRAAGASP